MNINFLICVFSAFLQSFFSFPELQDMETVDRYKSKL